MQVQNNKEEIPFAHYEEKFALLDPAEAAALPMAMPRSTASHRNAAGQHVPDRMAGIRHFLRGRTRVRTEKSALSDVFTALPA